MARENAGWAGYGKLEMVSLPSLAALLLQLLDQILLAAFHLHIGKSQQLAEGVLGTSAAKRGGTAGNGVLLCQQVKHGPFKGLKYARSSAV